MWTPYFKQHDIIASSDLSFLPARDSLFSSPSHFETSQPQCQNPIERLLLCMVLSLPVFYSSWAWLQLPAQGWHLAYLGGGRGRDNFKQQLRNPASPPSWKEKQKWGNTKSKCWNAEGNPSGEFNHQFNLSVGQRGREQKDMNSI